MSSMRDAVRCSTSCSSIFSDAQRSTQKAGRWQTNQALVFHMLRCGGALPFAEFDWKAIPVVSRDQAYEVNVEASLCYNNFAL